MAGLTIAVAIPGVPVIWAVLGVFGAVGLLALVSPQRFSLLTSGSSKWVDTEKLLATLDKRIDVDHYVLPFSRALGFAVVGSVVIIGVLLQRYLG